MVLCRNDNAREVTAIFLKAILIPFCLFMVLSPVTMAETEGEPGAAVPKEPPPPDEEVQIPAPTPELSGEEVPDWVARWELARVLGYLDRLEESAFEYEKLLEAKPNLLKAQLERINILARLGEEEQANELLNGMDKETLEPDNELLLANAYVQLEKYELAEEIYRDYLDANPEAEDVRLRLAEVLSWNEKYDESIAQYETLLEKRPDDINLRRKYAFVLIWSGNRQKGAEELLKTLD